jgi:hypothetical protein
LINPLKLNPKLNPIDAARQALRPSDADARNIDAERVEQLFRNRAELKKAYSEVQEELFRLKDRLKQQEGATAAVQELLDALEQRLGREESGYQTLVHYQLRRLWRTGVGVLEQFAGDQDREATDRERRVFLAALNREQFARRQEAEAAVRTAEAASSESSQAIARLRSEIAAHSRPWHHFKRKSLEAKLPAVEATHRAAEQVLGDLRAALDALLAEAEAPFPGLSVDAKRKINLALIAFAENLTQAVATRFAKSALLARARAAARRSEPADEYGSKPQCDALLEEIGRAQDLLDSPSDIGAAVNARVEALASLAVYASDAATVPEAASLAERRGDILSQPPRGTRAPRIPDVLGEDAWDLQLVLRR